MGQLTWMFSLLPDSLLVYVYYALFGLGVGLYIISKLVTWIPVIKSYKLPAELVGVLLFGAAAFLLGGYGTEMSWRQRVAELEAKIKEAEEKSAVVNTVIKEKIVYKTKIVKQKQIEYVDRIKEVAVQIDKKCEVDPAAIEILNKAAEDPTKGEAK
jgi:uncharacterized SAM-binding protein YcdF (DUF218 family)